MVANPSETDVELTHRGQPDFFSLIRGDGADALSVTRWFCVQLQWARDGRTLRTQALRRAMIADPRAIDVELSPSRGKRMRGFQPPVLQRGIERTNLHMKMDMRKYR
jgi:hypothetical protein